VTRTGADHERWAGASGGYVLGALEDGERSGFQSHLEGCPACREEVRRLQGAVDALPASVLQVAPPPELKGRVMAEVEREATLLAAAGAPADRPARRRRRAPAFWRPALAAAAALGIGLLLGLGLGGGEDVRTVPLAGAAQGELRVRDDGATLVVRGLAAPPPGRVYQVWVKRPGRAPEPTSTLFAPRADGSATAAVPGSVGDAEAVLVTDERAGGARAPTRAPVISADLS
jgi:anti-sigma-K factor RskA